MTRSKVLLFAAMLAAGCATTKTYQGAAPENVTVHSSISKMRGAMHVHEVDAACHTQYLGSVQLDQPSIALGLPPERLSYVVVSFEGSSFLGGSTTATSVGTLVKPRAGYRYQFEVTYRDSIYHVALRETDPRRGSSRELARRDLTQCGV